MTPRRQPKPEAQPERELPHDISAERCILGALLLNGAAFVQVAERLKPKDFYRAAHQRIFEAFGALLDEHKTALDLVTLSDELRRTGDLDEVGGPSYLAALIDGLPHSSNVLDYAGIVREKALLRTLIYTGNTIVQTAYDAELPANDILRAADRALLELQLVGDGRSLVEMRQQTKGLFDDLEHRVSHKGELTGIDTGFASINEQTMGWQAGDLIIVAARPSIGKTTFTLNSAVAAAQQGKRVAIFSLEMRRRQLEFRVLAGLSGIMLSKLLSGYIADSEYPKVSEALAVMDGLEIFVNDTAGLTAPMIRGKCRQLRADVGLDLVVVDYVQLMPGSLERRGSTRNEEITDISRRMKGLADELKVPVLLVSQLNRAAEGRADPRPKLSDLRESGALEQDADVVLFLHRKNHREGGVTNAILDKQRNGPTGTVNLTLDRDITKFTDGGVEVAPTAAEQETEHREQTRRAFARRAHSH